MHSTEISAGACRRGKAMCMCTFPKGDSCSQFWLHALCSHTLHLASRKHTGCAHLECLPGVLTWLPSCPLGKRCLAPGPEFDKGSWALGTCWGPGCCPLISLLSILSPPAVAFFGLCHSSYFGDCLPTEAWEAQAEVKCVLFVAAAPAQSWCVVSTVWDLWESE